MRNFFKKFTLLNLIFRLEKQEPNDYSFGNKVRKILHLYKEKKEVKEEEIFKEIPKI